jgi:acyl-CoA reductase-like NAD-dependent aldehyde dehydrogenase
MQVAFTGSTVTGRKIMQAAALSNLKKVSVVLSFQMLLTKRRV